MKNKPRRKQTHKRRLLVLAVVLGGYSFWAIGKPLPLLYPESSTVTLSAKTSSAVLPWPGYGQSAVGIKGEGVLGQNGGLTKVPIASVAKVITALVVLQEKPLALGQQGPSVTLGPDDIALYNQYLAKEGSLVPVNNGEVITQYQMLEAVLLPSSNNMADSLAIWAFGSLDAYAARANEYLKKLGLKNTRVADDASGFSPGTVSNVNDLVLLGEAAMTNPIVAEIVGKAETSDVPVAGRIFNGNSLLGRHGIVGIKTGTTIPAGGVFLGASKVTINSREVTIITAIAGAPTRARALEDTVPLTIAAQNNFQTKRLIPKGSVIGNYKQPWGGNVKVVASEDLNSMTWSGLSIPVTVKIKPLRALSDQGDRAGTITAHESLVSDTKHVSAVLATEPTRPSVWWRLLHPF